jgi:hypothetical protein
LLCRYRNAFALLNYAIEASLTGNKYAYTMDTNSIIQEIYNGIPQSYKNNLPYLHNIKEAGNPILYYLSIIYYLKDNSIDLLLVNATNKNWKRSVLKEVEQNSHLPHCITIEIRDAKNGIAGDSSQITNKPLSFVIHNTKYVLDSCIIRNTAQHHFCAVITCEKTQEMGYDGLSYHRLTPFEWKQYINKNYNWGFEGSNGLNGLPLTWNFLHGYQMLLYYRVN